MGRRESSEEIERTQGVKVYVIYEGRRTEPNYFQFFAEEHSSGHFSIEPIPKDYFDIDNTDREDLVSIMRGYITEQKSGELTSFWFATKIMKKVVDRIPCDPNNLDDDLRDYFFEARKSSVESARKWGAVDKNDIITNYGMMMDIITGNVEELLDEYEIDPDDLNPDLVHNEEKEDFGNTMIFIVFDRDYSPSRTDEDYLKIFEECKKFGYEILLSTPHFEFWLLMHHDGVDLSQYGYRTKEEANAVVLELERREGYTGPTGKYKGINWTRFNKFYRDKFEQAVENSKQGFLSLVLNNTQGGNPGLINNTGSNVGIMLDSLIKK